MLPLLVLVGSIAGAWYLLIVRPQAGSHERHQRLVEQLSVGDHVMTIGGIYGRVASIDGASLVLDLGSGVATRVAVDGIARIVHAGEAAIPEGTALPMDTTARQDTTMHHDQHQQHQQQPHLPQQQHAPAAPAPAWNAPQPPFAQQQQPMAWAQQPHAPQSPTVLRAHVIDAPTMHASAQHHVPAPVAPPMPVFQPFASLPMPVQPQHAPAPAPQLPQFAPQQQQQYAPQPVYQHSLQPQTQPQQYAPQPVYQHAPPPQQYAPQPVYQHAPQPQPQQHAPQHQPQQYAPEHQPQQYAPQHQPVQYAPQPQPVQFAPQPQQHAPQHQPMQYGAPQHMQHQPPAPGLQLAHQAMPGAPMAHHATHHAQPAAPEGAQRSRNAPAGMGSSLRLDDPSISDAMDRARRERSDLAEEYRRQTAPLVTSPQHAHAEQTLQLPAAPHGHPPHQQHGLPVPAGAPLFAGPGAAHAAPGTEQYPSQVRPARVDGVPRPIVGTPTGMVDPALHAGAFHRPTPYAPASAAPMPHTHAQQDHQLAGTAG